MLESARLRLQYFDVGMEEIRALEESGKVKKTVLIRSPFTGVVTFKSAVQGSFCKIRGPNYSPLADLSRNLGGGSYL